MTCPLTHGSGSPASPPSLHAAPGRPWSEDGVGKQMGQKGENHVLEVCEVMDEWAEMTWPLSEHSCETMATTEITEHLRISEERRPFFPTSLRNSSSLVLETKNPLLSLQLEHSFPVGFWVA